MKKQRDPQGFTASLLASGARLAIDGEPSTFESPEAENFWFSRCSFLPLNDFAFAKFCRKDPHAVERLVRGHPDRTVVHTMGEAGCTVYRSDGRWFCPACPVQAVDTTGAGDTFNAAYLHMHRKGNDPAACAAFACAAAAKSTLTRSPRAGAVGEGAVLAFMEQMRYSPRILREKL